MDRQGSVISIIVCGAMLVLSGCGSSDSSDEPVVVVTPPAPPPVVISGEKLMISGAVTDMPIANATVMITVDGQTFQAPLLTDADGNYEVEVTSDNPDALVMMEAFDASTGVRFTALLDDFAGFQSNSDVDGHIGEQNITNVTTAHYLLATNASDDGIIDSAAELGVVSERVTTAATLELAAAIKLVVENLDGVTLPAQYNDTQELAAAIADGSSTFLEDVAAVSPLALDNAIDLVLNDGNATLKWDQRAVAGVYVHREGFSVLALYPDGTGLSTSYDDEDVVMALQWTVGANGKLNVAYLSGDVDRDIVTLVGRHGNVLSVMVENTGPGDEMMDEQASTVLYYPFTAGFDESNVAGSYSTMGERGHLKVMQDEHTGYDLDLATGAQTDPFVWEVDGNGIMSLFDVTGGLTGQARVLGGAHDGGLHLLVTDYNSAGQIDHLDMITVRRTDTIAVSAADVDANTLQLAGNAYATVEGDDVSIFRFRADGQLIEVSQRPVADTVELVERRGGWDMIDDQTVRTRFDDQSESEDVRILDGLGADQMSIQTPRDIADGTERVVTRIERISPDTVTGGYYLLDELSSDDSEYVQLYSDFTGEYWIGGIRDRAFDWKLDENGSLVIALRSDNSFQTETLTLHMLSGSSPGEEMRFVAVRRMNGKIQLDGSTNRAITVLRILREG